MPKPPATGARRLTQSVAMALDRCGMLKLHFQKHRSLRILCYHGVCADEVADEPWVPSYFVSATDFTHQMEIVRRFGPVVPLAGAVEQLAGGSSRVGAAIAITFDDVAACSFVHARPVLATLGIRASFFFATGHVTTGRLFDADVLRLLRWRPDLLPAERCAATARDPALALGARMERLVHEPHQHKRITLEELHTALDEPERVVRGNIEPMILETLRPMSWDEVGQLAEAGHEVGGHTVDHAVLSPQSAEVRRQQIRESVTQLETRLNRKVLGFAYPNGGPGDFGPEDYATLHELGLRYALTTRAGFAAGADVFALPRVCIDASHTPASFALELSGLLDRRRQRQQGWL